MKLSILQIIITVLSLVMLSQIFLRYTKREQGQTFFKLTANIIIWGGILTFALLPALAHSITLKLGFGENLNTLIFLGFIVIFLVITKIIRIIERVERNISEIVRKEALSKLEKNNK